MKLDSQAVERIALLARLKLDPAEAETLGAQLSNILTYVEKLRALDTRGVPPTAHVEAMGTPLRDDQPHVCLDPEAALANAPDSRDGMFRVPKIIE